MLVRNPCLVANSGAEAVRIEPCVVVIVGIVLLFCCFVAFVVLVGCVFCFVVCVAANQKLHTSVQFRSFAFDTSVVVPRWFQTCWNTLHFTSDLALPQITIAP